MTAQAPSTPSLAATLRSVHVGLREDLEVSRHVFRGEPCYIVRDPMTFQSQRLALAEYELFSAVHAGQKLGAIFHDLVSRGRLATSDEERFFDFVVRLHRLGFLQLPVSDDRQLYRRYQLRQRARRREKVLGFLFLRVPLWNPSSFLDRTRNVGHALFSRGFFAVWLMLVGLACYVALARWRELVQPIHGVLVAHNLPLLWTTLIVLKVFHEMGHAYACRHYGGHVPEMGVYLILFTPCAYMDATAAWGFPRKRERIIVSLAGMYMEGFLAAVAVFIWAATEPSWINSLAYNIVFLAGVVTVLFNINPLMRYDGYYILSDWLEIPNLRQRASQQIVNLLKRVVLGIRAPASEAVQSLRLRLVLSVFGALATAYRITLLIALVALLASRLAVIGVLLGVGYLAVLAISTLRRVSRYLWYSTETAPVRIRAVAVSASILLLLPALVIWAPLPANVQAPAVLATEGESVIRTRRDGFLEHVCARAGQQIDAGTVLAELSNDHHTEETARARATLRAAEIRREAFSVTQPARALQQEIETASRQAALAKAKADAADLNVVSPQDGQIVECVRDSDLGRFLPAGSPLAVIASGAWQTRALLTESDVVSIQPRVGHRVEFRSAGGRSALGRIQRIAPAASPPLALPALTHLGGGDIAIDLATGLAAQPLFEITIQLPASPEWRTGLTGVVSFDVPAQPMAHGLARRLLRFWYGVLRG